jgi:hypothetical protein
MPKSSTHGSKRKAAEHKALTPEHAGRVKGGKLPGMRKPPTVTLKRG